VKEDAVRTPTETSPASWPWIRTAPRGSALALLLCLLAGCGGASARVVYPAELSARSYPRIIVVHGSEPEGIEFANRLARHLATPRAGIRPSEVFLMHRIQATQAVAERTFPQSAVIVDLDFQITHTGLIYETRDGCYTTGCAGRPATTTTHLLREVSLTLTLTIRESTTGRVLEVVTQAEHEDGGRRDRNVEVVLRRLQQRIFPMFDSHTRGVRLRVFDVEHPAVIPGLELLRAGQWTEASASLEAALADESVLALPPEQLARVYYNLSVARRFDPATMGDLAMHYANARILLDGAIQLDPSNEYYVRVSDHLDADAQRAAALRVQEGAAAQHYGDVAAPAPAETQPVVPSGAPPTVAPEPQPAPDPGAVPQQPAFAP
jgi:hypothetical protein